MAIRSYEWLSVVINGYSLLFGGYSWLLVAKSHANVAICCYLLLVLLWFLLVAIFSTAVLW